MILQCLNWIEQWSTTVIKTQFKNMKMIYNQIFNIPNYWRAYIKF